MRFSSHLEGNGSPDFPDLGDGHLTSALGCFHLQELWQQIATHPKQCLGLGMPSRCLVGRFSSCPTRSFHHLPGGGRSLRAVRELVSLCGQTRLKTPVLNAQHLCRTTFEAPAEEKDKCSPGPWFVLPMVGTYLRVYFHLNMEGLGHTCVRTCI